MISMYPLKICMVLAFASGAASVMAAPDDCPPLDTAKSANEYRMNPAVGPLTFAFCLSSRVEQLPTSGENLSDWLTFYEQSSGRLRTLYMKQPVRSETRASFSADELALRAKYREAITNRLSDSALAAPEAAKLRTRYAVSVAAEYDLILRRSQDGMDDMQRAHELLLTIDPLHLLDQTGTKWADVVRSCPSWKPGTWTPVAAWCEPCRVEFEKASARLKPWAEKKSVSEVGATLDRLRIRSNEITQSCKG